MESPTWTARPNTGHRALVTLKRRGVLDTLVTQNIDGLHQEAGSDPDRVVEIHRDDALRRVPVVRRPHADARCARPGGGGRGGPAVHRVALGEAVLGNRKSATIEARQNLVVEDLVRSEKAAAGCDLLLRWGPCSPSIRRPAWSPRPSGRCPRRHRERRADDSTTSPTSWCGVRSATSSGRSSPDPDHRPTAPGRISLRLARLDAAPGRTTDTGDGAEGPMPPNAA